MNNIRKTSPISWLIENFSNFVLYLQRSSELLESPCIKNAEHPLSVVTITRDLKSDGVVPPPQRFNLPRVKQFFARAKQSPCKLNVWIAVGIAKRVDDRALKTGPRDFSRRFDAAFSNDARLCRRAVRVPFRRGKWGIKPHGVAEETRRVPLLLSFFSSIDASDSIRSDANLVFPILIPGCRDENGSLMR